MGYIAYELDKKSRKELLQKFPPKYENVKCDHITWKFGVNNNISFPINTDGEVIGYAYTNGLETLVVQINGNYIRPDGKIYHITLSHDNKHKPVQSNNLLKNGWKEIPDKIKIKFKAEYFK